jgi:hypothetical protein
MKKSLATANSAPARNMVPAGTLAVGSLQKADGRAVDVSKALDFLSEQGRMNFMLGQPAPYAYYPNAAIPGQSTTNFNNEYNINSVADPFSIADEIGGYQQRQLNKSFSEFNNGPRY